jgi:hypothetical protein
MVLYDMKILRYPEYTLSTSERSVWRSRDEWLRYEWAVQLEIAANDAIQANPKGSVDNSNDKSALLLPSSSQPNCSQAFSWDVELYYQSVGCHALCQMCLLRIAAYRLLHLIFEETEAERVACADPLNAALPKPWEKALRAHVLEVIEAICTSPMPKLPKIPEHFPQQRRSSVSAVVRSERGGCTETGATDDESDAKQLSDDEASNSELQSDNSFARRFQEGWVIARTVTHLVRLVEKHKKYAAHHTPIITGEEHV